MLLRQHGLLLFLTHAWSTIGFPSEFCLYSLCRLLWKSDQFQISWAASVFWGQCGHIMDQLPMDCAAVRADGGVEARWRAGAAGTQKQSTLFQSGVINYT